MQHFRLSLGLATAVLGLAGCPSDSPSDDDGVSTGGGIPNNTDSTTGNGDGVPDDDAGITTDNQTGDGDSSTGEMNCGEENFQLDAVPPNVMLVLDRSGSMADNSWDGDDDMGTPDVSRWNSLFNVVESVVTSFDLDINFGAQYFPSDSAQDQLGQLACLVDSSPEVPVDMMNADNVLNSLPAANTMDLMGATPATAGVESALEHLRTQDENVDRFVILVTDGAANCSSDSATDACPGLGCELMENYDERLPAVVGSAFEDEGIPTFVVGIDVDPMAGVVGMGDDGQVEADTYVRLNEVAVAGGRALDGDEKFFNAQNEIELQSALDQIAGQVFSCTLPLSSEPLAPDFVEVEVGGETWEQVEDCTAEDGWVYTNPDGPYDAIELCGAACEALGAAGTLDVTFGCPPPG